MKRGQADDSEGMNHHPHLPTRTALRGIATAAVIVTLLSGCLSSDQQTALDRLNHDRTTNGRATLALQTAMQTKAQAWADRLAHDGYLHHSALPDGSPSCWRSLGENVGYAGSLTAVEAAFMASTPHRANILNATFTKAGVGVAWSGTRVYVVQEFVAGC